MGVDKHFEIAADELFVARDLNLPLAVLQNSETPGLLFLRNRVGHIASGRIRAWRIFEGVNAVGADCLEQRKRVLEVPIGLARKTGR